MFGLFGPDARRRRLLKKAPEGPLRDFLAVPFPARRSDWRKVPFVALDLETTGGDPQRDEIVSFGWVCIEKERIVLSTARHRVLRLRGDMSPESAVIHRITDDESAEGAPLDVVLSEFLAVLAGRVMVAHYTPTEVGFIAAASRRVYGAEIVTPAVDTLALATTAAQLENRRPVRGEFRLGNLRRRFGLPRYPAHNALSDALSAAELFLALASERRGPIDLGMLLVD
ncbi:MAG: 3'-5' exonuclease [Rhodocyclaceae bacterium]|nr:3'-5' exonuclease [Rhodocyclaceae bacterium]